MIFQMFMVVLCQLLWVHSFVLNNQPLTVQDVMIEVLHLQQEISALKSQLTAIQSSPSTTWNKHVAFMASLTNNVQCTGEAPVIFDHERLDTQMAYDVRHGVFRAPMNGTYAFSMTLMAQAGKMVYAHMVRNSVSERIGYVFINADPDRAQERSTFILVDLTVGDDVWIACLPGETSDIDGGHLGLHSFFSGFLVN
ncbi:hypothetical protein DPMN_044385 [Dreissena polymorpha]|uniref:C1q domain-containing protein n=1 Tax=Dreissena polymorpha TaxID=45954 RepID=A0A9D4D350_DREPO|nr:hypothetical protein DPMN_044385 [Dreissena polymorpha]